MMYNQIHNPWWRPQNHVPDPLLKKYGLNEFLPSDDDDDEDRDYDPNSTDDDGDDWEGGYDASESETQTFSATGTMHFPLFCRTFFS